MSWWFLISHTYTLYPMQCRPSSVVHCFHYNDVIMSTMASQITSLIIVYSTVFSGADKKTHQSSASLAFVRGIHRRPVNSLHKWPVTRKMFPCDDVIMLWLDYRFIFHSCDIFTHILRVTSLALGQSYDSSASEVTLKNMGIMGCHQTVTKHKKDKKDTYFSVYIPFHYRNLWMNLTLRNHDDVIK